MSRHYMTWEEYQYTVEEIVREIKQTKKIYLKIGTFTRGGLIPAAHIANLLGIHNISILNKDLPEYYHSDYVLIVDDISDTGQTLKPWMQFDIACLTYKTHTAVRPTYHSVPFEPEEWVVFPWEKKDSEEMRDRDVKEIEKTVDYPRGQKWNVPKIKDRNKKEEN